MKNPPSFQFYPADFLVDTQGMTPAEVGVYIRLICHCWIQDGLPEDLATIRRLADAQKGYAATLVPKVLKLFQKLSTPEANGVLIARGSNSYRTLNGPQTPPGIRTVFHHKRLLVERQKQRKYHDQKRLAGKRSATKKRCQFNDRSNDTVVSIQRPLSSSSSDFCNTPPTPPSVANAPAVSGDSADGSPPGGGGDQRKRIGGLAERLARVAGIDPSRIRGDELDRLAKIERDLAPGTIDAALDHLRSQVRGRRVHAPVAYFLATVGRIAAAPNQPNPSRETGELTALRRLARDLGVNADEQGPRLLPILRAHPRQAIDRAVAELYRRERAGLVGCTDPDTWIDALEKILREGLDRIQESAQDEPGEVP